MGFKLSDHDTYDRTIKTYNRTFKTYVCEVQTYVRSSNIDL